MERSIDGVILKMGDIELMCDLCHKQFYGAAIYHLVPRYCKECYLYMRRSGTPFGHCVAPYRAEQEDVPSTSKTSTVE